MPRFGICVDNTGYTASLDLNKVYRILRDARAEQDDFIRVIDESGEDYLYPKSFFVVVELPRGKADTVRRSLAATQPR